MGSVNSHEWQTQKRDYDGNGHVAYMCVAPTVTRKDFHASNQGLVQLAGAKTFIESAPGVRTSHDLQENPHVNAHFYAWKFNYLPKQSEPVNFEPTSFAKFQNNHARPAMELGTYNYMEEGVALTHVGTGMLDGPTIDAMAERFKDIPTM